MTNHRTYFLQNVKQTLLSKSLIIVHLRNMNQSSRGRSNFEMCVKLLNKDAIVSRQNSVNVTAVDGKTVIFKQYVFAFLGSRKDFPIWLL